MPIFPTGVFSATNPTPSTSRASGTTGPAEQIEALNGEVEAIETWLQGALLPSGDASGATDSAALVAKTNVYGHVVLGPGNWYVSGVTFTASNIWLQGSGPGTVINVIAGDTAFTLSNPASFSMSDLALSLGAASLGLNVNGASDSHFWNLKFTGSTATGGVLINGDDATEQHWSDIVMRNVGGIAFDYERTTSGDTGGLYLDRVRIVAPPGSATNGFKFNGTNATAPSINLFMNECVADNYSGEACYIKGLTQIQGSTCWFSNNVSSASGSGALHITGSNTNQVQFVNTHTIQVSSAGTAAFCVLIDGSAGPGINFDNHSFFGSGATALGLAAASLPWGVLGNYYSNCSRLTDTLAAFSQCVEPSMPRVFYTNGSGGSTSCIGIVDTSSMTLAKFIRNSSGTLQVLNNAFSTAVLTLSDGGDLVATGTLQVGASGVELTNAGSVLFRTTGGGALWGGSGAPATGLGSNGDYYLRSDGGVTTHIYFKATGSWAGIV